MESCSNHEGAKALDPAATVLAVCGGIPRVAALLELSRSSVWRWTQPKEKGGTGGVVPTKHQSALLKKARDHGIRLFPSDFFTTDVAA